AGATRVPVGQDKDLVGRSRTRPGHGPDPSRARVAQRKGTVPRNVRGKAPEIATDRPGSAAIREPDGGNPPESQRDAPARSLPVLSDDGTVLVWEISTR